MTHWSVRNTQIWTAAHTRTCIKLIGNLYNCSSMLNCFTFYTRLTFLIVKSPLCTCIYVHEKDSQVTGALVLFESMCIKSRIRCFGILDDHYLLTNSGFAQVSHPATSCLSYISGFQCYLIALFSKGLFGYSRIGFNFSCSVCKPSAKRERKQCTHKQTNPRQIPQPP